MSDKFLSYLVTVALGVTLALASPAFGRGGGGGGGVGGGGALRRHGWRWPSAGRWVVGVSVAWAVVASAPWAVVIFAGGISPWRIPRRFRHRVFDHRLHRFVFWRAVVYAYYDSCYRRVWTPVGLQWVNICGIMDTVTSVLSAILPPIASAQRASG